MGTSTSLAVSMRWRHGPQNDLPQVAHARREEGQAEQIAHNLPTDTDSGAMSVQCVLRAGCRAGFIFSLSFAAHGMCVYNKAAAVSECVRVVYQVVAPAPPASACS